MTDQFKDLVKDLGLSKQRVQLWVSLDDQMDHLNDSSEGSPWCSWVKVSQNIGKAFVKVRIFSDSIYNTLMFLTA
jgi:hypothetical protein